MPATGTAKNTSTARTLVLALAAAATLGACARRDPLGEPDAPVYPNAPVVIRFENQSQAQASVYIVPRGGLERRVATVQPGRTETIRLARDAWGAAGAVNIVARLIGSGATPSTGQVSFTPGLRLQVTLPSAANTLTVLPAP